MTFLRNFCIGLLLLALGAACVATFAGVALLLSWGVTAIFEPQTDYLNAPSLLSKTSAVFFVVVEAALVFALITSE